MTAPNKIAQDDQNPLTIFSSYEVKHVLVGFRFSEDACTYTVTPEVGVVGTHIDTSVNKNGRIGNCRGPAVVFVNEISDPTFAVLRAETQWDFFSNKTPTTGTYVGSMHIIDRVGMLFAQSLRKYCDELDMALGHITFVWRTYFTGYRNDNGEKETVVVNPMVFHITNFIQSLTPTDDRSYIMTFVSSYNTYGQLPQFSKMFQTTLTHADGNTDGESPTALTSVEGGLMTRAEEDGLKMSQRKNRLDKGKPMRTLKDVYDSLRQELNSQGLPNRAQIQEWQECLRPSHSRKIEEPKQFLPDLPIKYVINPLPSIASANIDNRNLPFEQPSSGQGMEGISAIPFHMGTTIPSAIDTIMLMSKYTADLLTQTPAKSYRSTTTVLRGCDGSYGVNINLREYVIPKNTTNGIDTGPGDGVLGGPIELDYQDSEHRGRNIRSILYQSNVTPTMDNLEEVSGGSGDGSGVVYGDREPITIQRMPQKGDNFFTSGFTGMKTVMGVMDINGLENASLANRVRMSLSPGMIKQTTSYQIILTGNPYLVNDLNRNPIDVKDDKGGDSGIWPYIMYDKVEYIPMYLKLRVHMRAAPVGGDSNLEETYFYSGFIHITRVNTVFDSSGITQSIEGVRTEESI